MVLDINPQSWELLATERERRKYKKKIVNEKNSPTKFALYPSLTHGYDECHDECHDQAHCSMFTETRQPRLLKTNQMVELKQTMKFQLAYCDAYTTMVSH